MSTLQSRLQATCTTSQNHVVMYTVAGAQWQESAIARISIKGTQAHSVCDWKRRVFAQQVRLI